jgi:hypothetical protein
MTIQPIWTQQYDKLPLAVYETNEAGGMGATEDMSLILWTALAERGEANLILVTGNSTYVSAYLEANRGH